MGFRIDLGAERGAEAMESLGGVDDGVEQIPLGGEAEGPSMRLSRWSILIRTY